MKKMKKIALSIIALMCISLSTFAQNKVTGTVIDEIGEPVIGATVKVVGQNTSGTITDINGNYTIEAPKDAKVVISYIGYTSLTVKAGGQAQLKPDAQNLDEVVVVGYGTQKKAHLTGSIATVPMDEITDLSASGLASTLSGLVNGVSVSGGQSRPGENATIRIRDTNDLSEVGVTSQSPLYVIDGYIYPNDMKVGNGTQNLGEEAFNNLDPNEVENISVLKDAAAAVYGARAANGVILVTTKKGKAGKPKISYSGQYGFTDAVSTPKMLSAYEWGRLYNAVTASDPKNTSLDNLNDLYQADELNAMRGLNYDLLDDNWKTGATYKHGVNISGGSDNVTYFGNVSYFTQDGNIGKLDYDRWNYRAGIDVKINKWIKANLNVSGDYGTKKKPLIKIGGSNEENDYRYLLTRPRYIPEYVGEYPIIAYGIKNQQTAEVDQYHFDVLQNNGDYRETKTNNTTINGSIDVDMSFLKPLKGLNLKLTYSKSINNTKGNEYGSAYTLYQMVNRTGSGKHLYTPVDGEIDLSESNFKPILLNNGDYLSRDMSRADNYQVNFTASYNRDFGQHTVGALFSIERSESESEYLKGQVAQPYEFTTGQSNSASGDQTTDFKRAEAGTLSYIGRLNYAYANKYLFEFLFRADASTKFAPENFWGYFPSASAGWVISEEKWFQDALSWVDFLKIRASYGLTGRDNTAAWQWMQVYAQDADRGVIFGEGTNIATSNRITINKVNSAVNRDIHWDKSYKFNAGLDISVLQKRLGFTVDYYYVRNREMLMNIAQNVAGTVGTQSAAINLGEMDNWGWEFSVNWKDKIGENFKYHVGLNTGYTDNEVLVMDWATDYLYRQIRPGHRSDVGTWGLQCLGMFRSFQDIEEYFEKYNITSYMGMSKDEVRPGMLIYKDVRGLQQEDGTAAGPDGVVDAENDLVRISNRSNPYGFTINFGCEYKRFSLSGQFSANWGGYTTMPTWMLKPAIYTNGSIVDTNMPSFWNVDNMYSYQDILDGSGNVVVAENHDANYPNLAYSVNSQPSTFWRISAARVALKNLTLAYSLPTKWLNTIGIQSCRINVTGQNLLSLYNPYPENFMDPMMTYGSYPTLRKFTVGVNVSF